MKDYIQGPWRKGTGISDVIVNADGEYIASVWGRTADEARARTSLIADAPAMAALLKKTALLLVNGAEGAITDTVWSGIGTTLWEEIANLLEQATGEVLSPEDGGAP